MVTLSVNQGWGMETKYKNFLLGGQQNCLRPFQKPLDFLANNNGQSRGVVIRCNHLGVETDILPHILCPLQWYQDYAFVLIPARK